MTVLSTSWRTVLTKAVAEQTSATITGTLTSDTGAAIPAADLTTLTVTRYEKVSGTILNARSGQNILNANGGTVNAAGLLTLQLDPLDHVLQSQGAIREIHVTLIEATWNAGTKTGRFEIEYPVVNLTKVS